MGPAVQRLTKQGPHKTVARYNEPVPAIKQGLYSHLALTPTAKKVYPTTKHTKVLTPYNAQPYQAHYTEDISTKELAGLVVPAYSGQGTVSPHSGTAAKYTAKLAQYTPSRRQHSAGLKHLTEKYKPDEGFAFGAEKFY